VKAALRRVAAAVLQHKGSGKKGDGRRGMKI